MSAPPSPQQLLEAVLADIPTLEPEALTLEAHFRTLPGWDSLAGLMLLSLLETTFAVDATPAELRRCQTMREVHALLVRKLAAESGKATEPEA